jgi:hypothetical protein
LLAKPSYSSITNYKKYKHSKSKREKDFGGIDRKGRFVVPWPCGIAPGDEKKG